MFDSHSEIYDLQKRLKQATKRMHELAPLVGHARQVQKFDTERRKGLLAKYAVPAIKSGQSAASANMEARANPSYQVELEGLTQQSDDAQKTIAEWEAAKCTYEAARSLLSMAKTTIQTLE
jgi:hypothetical protein